MLNWTFLSTSEETLKELVESLSSLSFAHDQK
jgi:hypothetical protein